MIFREFEFRVFFKYEDEGLLVVIPLLQCPNFPKTIYLNGVIKKWPHWAWGRRGRVVLRISAKKWHRVEGMQQIVTSPPNKELYLRFYFSLVFGQHGSSWALISILVVCPFKHWLESARRLINPDLRFVKSVLV